MPTPKEIADEAMAASLKASFPDAAASFPHSTFVKVAGSVSDGMTPMIDQKIDEKVQPLVEQIQSLIAQIATMNTQLTAVSGALPAPPPPAPPPPAPPTASSSSRGPVWRRN